MRAEVAIAGATAGRSAFPRIFASSRLTERLGPDTRIELVCRIAAKLGAQESGRSPVTPRADVLADTLA